MKEKIILQKGDITVMDVDAIVNAANNDLIMGGGVAGAILRKGGQAIQEECDKIGTIPIGEAAITTGGKLKARHVIHAASMGLGGPLTTEKSLIDSTKNSLLRADEKGLKTIAFPAIGTGVAGFPVARCAELMIDTMIKHLKAGKSALEKVYFVLYDNKTYNVFKEKLDEIKE